MVEEWINEDKVEYFNLMEYIDKIKISDKLMYHAEETGQQFEEYIKTLKKYCDNDDYAMLFYWLDQNAKELRSSSKLENHVFTCSDLYGSGLFFEKMSINHERIKRIHKFVCENNGNDIAIVGEYRRKAVNVGAWLDEDHYQVYWNAPEARDVKKFMDDYLTFYRTNSIRDIFQNPFFKAALAHLLFVRIHPFMDGNGRTARIIQNICFTSSINKIYGTKLTLSPLNISQSICRNQLSYADYINRVHFDLKHNNVEAINNWLNFILYMYDEQLYYQTDRIPKLRNTLSKLSDDKITKFADIANKSKINKL